MKIIYQNQYAQKVFEILAPLVGDLVTKGVIKTQSQKIGKTEETIDQSDIPKIAEGVKMGINIFVGSEVSSQVAMKISMIR